MFEHVEISPSVLSADFLNLEHEVRQIVQAGAKYIHVDVMDGHFVPNLTMGIPLLKALTALRNADNNLNFSLDIHLMIDNPLVQLPWFISCGLKEGDIVGFHDETLNITEINEGIELLHNSRIGACLSYKPNTPLNTLPEVIDNLDMVLIMSVEPGFSGQSYIKDSEAKVAEVVSIAKQHDCTPLIEVDGGINEDTATYVARAGADVLVCGNAIFAAQDPTEALHNICNNANNARIEALNLID